MELKGNNCMLDIESVGTKPGCAIVSLGAVSFNEHAVTNNKFYTVFSIKSQLPHDLRMNPETLSWWMQQSGEAREALLAALDPTTVDLANGLDRFALWYRTQGFNAVWANGASFDFAILTTAAQRVGREMPWKYRDERCYRTLRALCPDVKCTADAGVAHNALADSIWQAQHTVDIFKRTYSLSLGECNVPTIWTANNAFSAELSDGGNND